MSTSQVAPCRIFIGWDSRFPEPAEVLAHSFREHTKQPLDIHFLKLDELKRDHGFNRVPDPLASTEFTYSRFLVPYLCGYEGRALFVDNDMLCLGDIAELYHSRMVYGERTLALRVVKHDYQPIDGSKKMGGAVQTAYPRKNWSSLMLMECAELKAWTKNLVETAPGARLHRFQDIPDEKIGGIIPEWNSLDSMNEKTKMIHWTSGMTWNEPGSGKTFPHQEVWEKARERFLTAGAK